MYMYQVRLLKITDYEKMFKIKNIRLIVLDSKVRILCQKWIYRNQSNK